MIEKDFAEQFAAEWIEAWNSQDLERVLAHYAEELEMVSPLIPKITGEASGVLTGKQNVRAYWKKALRQIPDLHFELAGVYAGVSSITIYYKGHRGFTAEVLHFNAARKAVRGYAHYSLS